MGKYLDFDAIKKEYSIEDAAAALRLVLKPTNNQMRGPCPVCKGAGDRALVITPSKQVFYCFGAKRGGDQLALVAHINDCSVKEAAEWLGGGTSTVQETSTGSQKNTLPESEGAKEADRSFQALTYLDADHEMVIAVGFDTEFCKAHGIGYAPKGIMRGTVAIPFRDENGALLGYIGVEECKLPPSFTPNVVSFKKTA